MWTIRSSQVHITWNVLLDLNGVVEKTYLCLMLELFLHKISGRTTPTTTQQLYSCKFNLESNHMFPIKPVKAVWGGGWGRGRACFSAWISSWETLSIWTNECSKELVKTGHQWAYLATGSSLAGVPGINKCSCRCSEKSTRTSHAPCRSIDDTWPKQEQQEIGAESLNHDFIASVAVVLQHHHKSCSPGCSFEAPDSVSVYSTFIDPDLDKQLVRCWDYNLL